MKTTTEFIYALYYNDFASPLHLQEGPDEKIFYVGRTSDPNRRLKQHRHKAKTGTEDNYVFIRDLTQKNVEWDLKILREIDKSDVRSWEYWYIIELIRKGTSLKNMRYGDFKEENRLKRLARDDSIHNIDDLERELKRKESESSPKYEVSALMQERAVLKSMRWLREETNVKNYETKKWNIYDLGEGTEEIKADYYMKKEDISKLLTPNYQERMKKLNRTAEQKHGKPWVVF